jgi:mono/diheme cytochrome c family protein
VSRGALPVAAALLAAALAGAASADGERWTAPAAARARVNPVPPSEAARQRGHVLFRKHCVSCHGEKGKGDGPAERFTDQPAADLSDRAVQERLTDGEIFWKITNGRRQGDEVVMPGIAHRVPSEEDRWKLVRFVRTLAATAP